MDYNDTQASSNRAEVDSPNQNQDKAAGEQSASGDKTWLGRIERCKRVRKDLNKGWSDNVDYRRGKPFSEYDDEDRVNVNLDWAFTKAKHAQLYSQTPQVYLTPKNKAFAPAVPIFQKQLNDTLGTACVGDTVDECVLDSINAAGVGICMVGYQALTEKKQIPVVDPKTLSPEEQQAVMSGQIQIPMKEVDQKVSDRFYITRVSPSEFLWPTEFTGSNFDQADWVGRSGKMLWSEARQAFPVLTPEDKEKVMTERKYDDNLRRDSENEYGKESMVDYDEVFYWAYRFDENEKYFKKIKRIVFVKGKNDPVIHEDWKGQVFDPNTKKYVGACKFPIRVLTLTYISDDAIPPSDTAIGRPQIEEMIRSRTQIVQNRDRSQPIRWADVNRVDPMVLDTIMRGEFQAFIPVQGDGTRVIGEVARASYPSEDFAFDKVIKEDLQEQWQIGPNQMGAPNPGRRSSAEANAMQAATQSKVGYERARVAAFFTNIAEVMGGLLALYGDFLVVGQEELQRMDKTWDRKHIGGEFVYWIRPDSTVLLDSNQRIDRIMKFLNLTGKSGFVNPKPLIAEVAELSGIDPAEVIVDPKPPKPDDPNISYRFSGVQDLTNPLTVALLMKAGQAPTPEELDAAKNLLASIDMPPQPKPPQGGPGGMGGPGGAPQPGAPPTPGGMPGGAPPVGGGPHANPGDAHPRWGSMPKVIKRGSEL